MFDTVLIANRGEIALRVARACRELGLRSIAVFSEADRDAPHVAYADDAYQIGPPPSSESYLNMERIIATARQAGAGAIHPGYGFLSENSSFARAVGQAGLVFVGPPPDAIESVGGKVAARNVAQAAKVPVVPGTYKPIESAQEALALAGDFGYPIAIKAVGGGGGRGLRVVRNANEIDAAFESARREAILSFKNGELYVEKYLGNPRHIEIQILADTHGNVVYVGERDCSVQRRHQKLIEECPSPVVTAAQRAEIGTAAVRLARTVGYIGAGTLEFLYEEGKFYFLELNSRIQVEHTVTEMVYGIDLVKAQLRIAQGEKLWFTQEDISPRGHAIECRINAEDPSANFRPALGTVGAYREPVGLGIRVDSGVRANYAIPQFYDSMVAKLIVWGQDRLEAISRMNRALADYQIENLTTTIPFHKAAINHPAFKSGDVTVNFIPQHPEILESLTAQQVPGEVVIPAEEEPQPPRSFNVEVNSRRFMVRVAEIGAPPLRAGAGRSAAAAPKNKPKAKSGKTTPQAANAVICPIPGVLAGIRVEPGQQVESGQILFVIEAMKMENEIVAPKAGKIAEIRAKQGTSIESGAVLATYATDAA